MEVIMKECKKCKENKPLSDFYKAGHYNFKGNEDGLDYYCKYCRNGHSLISHHNKSKKCSIDGCERPHYAKTWCRMHYSRWTRSGKTDASNKIIKIDREYTYDSIKINYSRAYDLMTKYKMKFEEYLERSANGCEICGERPERNLHVDHNHSCCSGPITCGKCVRGILCNKCNTAVDKYETNQMRLDYPNRWLIKEYVRIYGEKKG